MAFVYILHSDSLGKYYTGSCENLENRLKQHAEESYNNSFTRRAKDWKLFISIDNLEYKQARLIENHIKSMKSSKYIKNLKSYPDMVIKLIEKYK